MIIDKVKIGNNTYNVGARYQDISGTPTKLSDFANDEGFIDKSVNNLDNYTPSSQTTTKLELVLDSSTFKLKGILKDSGNNVIFTSNEVDLPLETMVVGASYDSLTKEIVLSLQNGTTVRFSVADLVSGLVSTTDLQTALASYYTKSETNALLNAKQDTLTAGNNITIENGVISASGGSSPLLAVTLPDAVFSTWMSGISGITANDNAVVLQAVNTALETQQDVMITVKESHSSYTGGRLTGVLPYTELVTLLNTNIKAVDIRGGTYAFPQGYSTMGYNRDYMTVLMDVVLSIYFTTNAEKTRFESATLINKCSTANVLITTNNRSYTPTGDYNPATKKYVDDSIASAITDALGGSY